MSPMSRPRQPVGRLVSRELATPLGPMTAIALVRDPSADLGLWAGCDAADARPAESICLLEFSDRRMLPAQLA
ncbi:MAG TPA: hypothetical protein VF802_04350, partial [Candidatus Limnocylindrales bacterium]